MCNVALFFCLSPINNHNQMDTARTSKDPFWLDQPSILTQYDRLIEFLPLDDHTENERLNAISRFVLYLGVLMTLYRKDFRIFVPVAIVPLLAIAFYRFKLQQDGSLTHEPMTNEAACKRPTRNNPFMNPSMVDYGSGVHSVKPCEGPSIDTLKQQRFEEDLIRDERDIFGKGQGRLNFNTIPGGTVPPDADGSFRRFLMGKALTEKTCKEKHGNCKPFYTTPRHQKPILLTTQSESPSETA